jgi:hypothetical protein
MLIGSRVDAPRTEILVPALAKLDKQIPNAVHGLEGIAGLRSSRRPSITVDTLQGRTVAKHGITGREIKRLDGATHFMAKHCPRSGQLFFASVHHASSRDLIANIQKRITKLQNGADLPPYSVWVFENSGGLHAHIIFVGDSSGSIANRLERSATFGALLNVAPVTDLAGLTREYLVKERTPQAGYQRQHVLGGRMKGSHRLEGGGDRVRLSRGLERDAIEAGHVDPWQHTNARRSAVRKPYSPRRRGQVGSAPTVQTVAPDEPDGKCAAAHGVSARQVGILHAPLRPTADAHRPIFDEIRALAAVVRTAKAHLARAKASAAKLAQSLSDLTKTMDFIEGIDRDLNKARSELQSEVCSRTNGGPPLDDAGRIRPFAAVALSRSVEFSTVSTFVPAKGNARVPFCGNPGATVLRPD